MKTAHILNFTAPLMAAILVIGCGKADDATVPTPPAIKPPEVAVAPAVAVNPTVTAPPTPSGTAVAPAPTAEAPKELRDPDGKTLTAIQYMQSLIDGYARTRASQGEGSLPALTSIEQLVQYRILARLPAAPEGQKFVLDQAGKVALAPN